MVRRRHLERGATALELALLAPVLIALTFALFEIPLLLHARNVAEAAAQQAVESARVDGGTDADAAASADLWLDKLGPNILTSHDVQVSRTPTTVTVTITGEGLSLIPGVPGIPVSATATGPTERFVAP